jgi:hypothetical protein
MGLFTNPLGHAGYPPRVTGTPETQPSEVQAATLAEANAGVINYKYISPATQAAAVALDFASPPALGFGSTTPRPVHATTLDSTGTTSLSTTAGGVTNIGTTTGTIGFFGTAASVKPTSTTDLRAALINLGLYTTGGATPLDLNGGALTAATVSATTTVTAGTGITATTGNITASTGNLVSTLGSVSAATTVTAGTGITATTGNIVASTGNITSTLGSVSAATIVTAGTNLVTTNGNLVLGTSGNKLVIPAVTPASDSVGISAALDGASPSQLVVATTAVTAASIIQLTCNTAGGTQGFLSIGTIVPGVSFQIKSSANGDTSTVNYTIIN